MREALWAMRRCLDDQATVGTGVHRILLICEAAQTWQSAWMFQQSQQALVHK